MIFIQQTRKCLKCNKGTLDTRVKRGLLARTFLFFLPIKRYMCNNCQKKAYVMQPHK